jgi:peptidoglycan-N-acetylglucosamine deacetylase
MATQYQIFQASSPSRWKKVKWTSRIILILFIFLLAVLTFALLWGNTPSQLSYQAQSKEYANVLDPSKPLTIAHNQNRKYKGFKDFLAKKTAEDSLKGANQFYLDTTNKNPYIRAAFYTPWNKNTSLPDLEQYGDKLNTIFPEWFFIDTLTYTLQTRIDSAGLAIMKKKQLRIMPIFNNFYTGKDFDGKLLHVILNDTAKRKFIIQQLVDTLSYYKLQGINIDFEELNEKTNRPLTQFQKELYEALHPLGITVTMDVAIKNDDYDYKKLSAYNDYIVLMAYDQFNNSTMPGPVSAQKWIEEAVDWTASKIESEKIILGFAGYGYDWKLNEDGKIEDVKDITYITAINTARNANAVVNYDNDSYNLYYSYIEEVKTKSGLVEKFKHEVWFTDAATAFNIFRFSDEYATAGTALWRMGSEDTRMWSYYNKDLSNDALEITPFNFNILCTVAYSGNGKPTPIGENGGELLDFLYAPQEGKITLQIDSAEQLITEQKYVQLPSGYVYKKFAEDTSKIGPGHKLILTFDDGPDPEWTPQILDILESKKIAATFFIVGLQGEKNIPLLQRINKDGFEIGNHTFTHGNIAKMSPERAEVELRLTRLLIETITGRSTILFRAPFNADSEPQTYEEIEPLARSKKDNYITVNESIDPNDWEVGVTADSIVARVIRQAEERNASIILLHDAGGITRKATVEALPKIIDYFEKKGCKFTTVADLMGKTKDDVMPKAASSFTNKLNFIVVEAAYWGGNILFALFITGIVLSIGRMVVMAILASVQMKKEKNHHAETLTITESTFAKVTVIVPAYNEQVNAVRTVNNLLQQNYPHLQIIFVDDGSKDNTFKIVSEAFTGMPNVQVHTKTNGGKSSALNYGINLASTDYVVCIDADTQLKTDAVSELMKKFTSTDVGAVAGNVKVGNEINMITRWQSIEYITSQNFDRRAFDLLNCITVVPGAIGAFKKEAIIKAGGFTSDTLAEDCDLTMRLHRNNYLVKNCNQAISYTEAPETMKQFMKQRFRWSFGVIQCFWKHRDAVLNPRYKNLGMVALPNILIFQMLLPFFAPLADLILVISLIAAGFGIIPASLGHIIIYYIIFSLIDIAGAALAFTFEKEDYKKLMWMIPQRLVYRQLMYYIIIKSFNRAIKGELQGWGVLKRTGNVKQVTTA